MPEHKKLVAELKQRLAIMTAEMERLKINVQKLRDLANKLTKKDEAC